MKVDRIRIRDNIEDILLRAQLLNKEIDWTTKEIMSEIEILIKALEYKNE